MKKPATRALYSALLFVRVDSQTAKDVRKAALRLRLRDAALLREFIDRGLRDLRTKAAA